MIRRAKPAATKAPSTNMEKRRMDSLQQHPENHIFRKDKEEIDVLAEDIREHGLQHPIDTLPDGKILCGQRRVEAYEALGRKETPCHVMLDLSDKGSVAQERLVMGDNLIRRQLKPAEFARCLRKELELAVREGRQRGDMRARRELEEVIAEKHSISSRALLHFLLLADCPRAVQDECDAGRVSMEDAIQVAMLPRERREQLEQQLWEGHSVKETLREALAED